MQLADHAKTDMLSDDTVAEGAVRAYGSRATSQHDATSHWERWERRVDVQESHVGVDIFGKQGTRAAGSGKYAIAEFKHLWRLVAVHWRH